MEPTLEKLHGIFERVDKDKSGMIDQFELQSALSNGHWTPFNPDTIRLMIAMFDKTGSQKIDFTQFRALWKYVVDWQEVFKKYDTDHSGNINQSEMKLAFEGFGYRFTPGFYSHVMKRFDRSNTGAIYFDDFIQACVVLQSLTSVFMEKDVSKTGVVTISYEDFLCMVFSARMS